MRFGTQRWSEILINYYFLKFRINLKIKVYFIANLRFNINLSI